jgi:triosephosphate isomerase
VNATSPYADVLICLPATLITREVETAAGRIAVGAEDCSAVIAGAFTGDISAEMLKDAGASAVIVGHSERRQRPKRHDFIRHRDRLRAAVVHWYRSLATSEEIIEVLAHIRKSLAARLGLEGKKVRILYGGSVKPNNARTTLALPEVGGALVGGASLKASDSNAIVAALPAAG